MAVVSEERRIAGAGTSAAAWRDDPALARLPKAQATTLIPPGGRAVLVAPHPDDEILAWGGLLQMLGERAGPPALLLVAVTDGEASHPDSTLWPRERLRRQRPRETAAALAALGLPPVPVTRLGLADGGVTAGEDALAHGLAALLHPRDVLVSTWRQDGHPDHEACARACAAAAQARGVPLLESPVWGWHWNTPDDNHMPLARARKLALSPAQRERKRAAMDCFVSQRTGDPGCAFAPIVPDSALARSLTDYEVFFI
jgi:LmbE family N-acetylglucosaminyl deacetylase